MGSVIAERVAMRTPTNDSPEDSTDPSRDQASLPSTPILAPATELATKAAEWSEEDLAELRLAWGMSRG